MIWVADIVDQCIVVLDFLLQHNCQVDVGNALLKVVPEEVPMRSGNVSEIRCRVVLQQEEIVPANSEALLRGKFTGGVNGEQELGRWASVNPGREQALGEEPPYSGMAFSLWTRFMAVQGSPYGLCNARQASTCSCQSSINL